jgi:hypothetical protein
VHAAFTTQSKDATLVSPDQPLTVNMALTP